MKSIYNNKNNASAQTNGIIKRHYNDQAATVEEILALAKKTTLQVDDPTKLCNILKRVGGGHSRFRPSGH
ncbi:hypothetical protein [Pseudochrobactrum sp. MP213Fo]|uniref:hypothetical protein n=1 Tax=Pseudochrobactrum sp. MP213Fo TaxID=3022250 RepID=UPI003BA089C3